ncbi:hypothetical protein ACHAW5_001449, partial [Stephanodiscus triporus]
CVTAGKALTHDESRIAGWYKNEITCGPEPKPIRTGATLHSLAVSFGILAGYKLHARRYITMDSAYMGDIMAQVGREVWGMNMVGTVQCNRSGADTKDTTKKMKKGTYESVCWQHNNKPLVFAAWGDNSVVKTLSNCHGPEILRAGDGVSRKRRGEDGKRERESTEGNGAERPYDMGEESDA